MRVLLVAYPFAPVCHRTPGGAEQVLLALDRALTRSGHESFVVARRGSKTSGRLLELSAPPGPIEDSRASVYESCRSVITAALESLKVDIVHMHGLDFHEYLPGQGPPVLVTLHLPLAWYPAASLTARRPCTYFNCVSSSQAASFRGPGSLGHIDNGVDVDWYAGVPGGKKAGGYALSMGRVCAEKGFHAAMDASAAAGVPFILAGSVFGYRSHEEYFREFIMPRLSPACRFIGPAGPEMKRTLLSGARCLVVPSLVAETSSLVAMEALASGTPVVAFPNGALSDIVEDGVTGFLVRDELEMSRAIKESRRISSEECRRAAARRFSSSAMIEKYLGEYARMAACGVENERS